MNDDHRDVRESLGAWVLGSLDGDERRAVESHLAGCEECGAEVAALSAVPGLLNRLSEDEVADGLLIPSHSLRDRLLAEVEAVHATTQRHLRRWRAAAFVATIAAAVALVIGQTGILEPTPPDFDRIVASVQPLAEDAEETTGEAAALAWEWGITVELDLDDLPAREGYVVWAVSDDGRRQQAGAWGSTESRDARVRGASSIMQDDLAKVEVTDATGEMLLTFNF